MAVDEITALLGGWPGFVIQDVPREPGGTATGAPQIPIVLAARPGRRYHCSRCGRATTQVHELTSRRVRELPILDAETWLVLPLARVRCPTCGPTVEGLPWLDRYARMTKRFSESVARLARVRPIAQVATHFGLSWDTVQAIDHAALERELGPVDLRGVRPIVLDEFAIQKGHRSATVIAEPHTRRVLGVARGRGREAIRPFFEALGPDGCAALEAVAMDMHEAYDAEPRAHCPPVAIVYDRFHIVATFGREVIDRVRVDAANRLARAAGAGAVRDRRRPIKGARWLLLRNTASLQRGERLRLKTLLAANRPLGVVYVLTDAWKALWRYQYPGAAARAWRQWYGWAIRSRIPALMRFAKQLKARLPGVLAHCRYPLHTGVLEGMNNKIKVLKRMAYGFRNDHDFVLKIRAAFPGIP